MARYEINGGHPLNGTVTISGAKNASRSANLTLRVPSDMLDGVLSGAGEWGEVTREQTSAVDMTSTYTDNASRLESARAKKRQLDALYEKAETMEDIITVESAISETEARIESLSGELQHYDYLVDYSTVYLSLDEVYRLSSVEEPVTTLGGRLGTAFSSGWKNFTGFLESLAVALAYSWVWVVVLIAAAAVVLRRLRRRRCGAGRITGKPEKKDDKPE